MKKKIQKETNMEFFKKLGNVLVKNMAYTIVFIVAFIFFLYFAGGDIIGGILTALSALIAYIAATLIYAEFKKAPAAKKSSKKK